MGKSIFLPFSTNYNEKYDQHSQVKFTVESNKYYKFVLQYDR
jgi:hypothetical protein